MGQYDSWDYLTNFLKKNPDNFEEELLKPPFAVKTKRHKERSNLVMFKYSQFGSDFTNPIVRCCRGTVYDIRKTPEENSITAKPYLLPFFKFMNYGEKGADPIDWNASLYIRDKLDGSLLKLLKEDDGGDLWTTNGSFEIDVQVPEIIPAQNDENLQPPYTFAGLRDFALRGHEEEIKNLPAGWTFMFELISPYNRIIVPYRETKLFLLGCRDPQGAERTPEWAAKNFFLSFATPQIYKFKNIDEVIKYCRSADTDDREGVVIQDANFNRIKLKTDHYRSLFYLKGDDHFSDSRIFDSIRQGSIDDAVAAWPEIQTRVEEITAEWIDFRNATETLCKKAASYYQECTLTADQKEAKKRYAMFATGKYKTFSSFLFEYIKENADMETYYNKIDYKELRNFWMPEAEKI
ncbi:MAG: hypothetical protein FWC22_07355 [Treponema sp.]|nr:hypothetical protein [Treponema sp.]